VLGLVAGVLRVRPVLRIAILLLPAVGVVALLGNAFELDELIAPACIPTAVGILLLERSTRPRAPDLPSARVM
jgi:energy-converting hydrogenase Eha subunit C